MFHLARMRRLLVFAALLSAAGHLASANTVKDWCPAYEEAQRNVDDMCLALAGKTITCAALVSVTLIEL